MKQKRWHGTLEGVHQGLLYGWALDASQPEARVVLEILLDDQLLCCVAADVARSDLAGRFTAACPAIADHCHGLVADLTPYANYAGGQLRARVANTDVMLDGSLLHATPDTPTAAALSKVEGDGALRLYGWARSPTHAAQPLTVYAYVGQQRVAEARADHPLPAHPELGNHGFQLNLPASVADGRLQSVRVVDQHGEQLNGSPINICCTLSGLPALAAPGDTRTAQLLQAYQDRLPRSLAWSGYAAWRSHFDAADQRPALTADAASHRIGLLINGATDAAAVSVASAAAPQLDIRSYSGQPFTELLRQAQADGCTLLACVRAGDTLAPQALAWMLQGLALPQAQLVYSDSEHDGRPWFKPAWNPDYALASDYPLELMLFRASLLDSQSTPPSTSAQMCWQVLATLWPQGADAIVHVPRVLYRYATPLHVGERDARNAAAIAALRQLQPQAQLAAVPAPSAGTVQAARRLQRPLSQQERALTISLIIPTRDRVELLRRCIDSLRRHSAWAQLELIVADNDSQQAATHRYLRQLSRQGVRVLSCPGPFNFAAINNQAVAQASGDIIGLINNDIEALHDGWLDEMLGQLLRPGVGAVGAKLLWPNGMVQHGGVLLGVGQSASHFGSDLHDDDWGDHGRNQLVQQVSGVTAACLLLRRQHYLALGGMDQQAFPVAFNDVDLCLKLRRAGLAIVWTPHARLLHAESASRGKEDTPQKRARAARELAQLRQRWGSWLLRDPAYHPSLNLDLHTAPFGGLATPPRPRLPRNGHPAPPDQQEPA